MRLIDADALEKEGIQFETHGGATFIALGTVRCAPTIEAEPVRHGRWEIGERTFCVKGKDGFIREETKLTYTCNQCGVGVVGLENMRYCPHCGAKMDAEK